ncbi:MAG: tyrosine-type recombinase/integrase [Acidobacteria bacterium]|nr:tyrosine-type recombinase/integrase [Acidobacteriota bacterium]
MSRIPQANRKFWFECDCPFWIVGRTPSGDSVPRQTTGFSDPVKAEAFRAAILAEHSPLQPGDGVTVKECVAKYLLSRKQELDERTLYQHKLALERLQTFLEAQGVVYIRQLTVDHLETFKTAGLPQNMASTSRATTDAKIRCFLRTAFRRSWIKEALVLKVTTVKAVYEQKEPYTDAEVDAILAEALRLDGGTHGYAKKPKTFRLLLELMLSTGLRVGDAVSFDPSCLSKGESLWVYTFHPQKTKKTDKPKTLEAYITADLKKRIDECDWLSQRGPFWYGTGVDPTPLAAAVYERMQAIGVKAEVADCRPHRLRDTFAVRALLSGMLLEDVSRLLGHSSVKVTETYYAKWVNSRKRRLEKLFAETIGRS